MTSKIQEYADIAEYAQQMQEPEWFTQLRVAARQKIPELVLPDFQKIKYRTWPINLKQELSVKHSQTADLNLETRQGNFVQVGPQLVQAKLPAEWAEKGVVVCDWPTALKEHPELVQKYFMTKATKPTENRLNAEHVANLTSGLLIYIPKNVILQAPLTTYFYQDAREKQDYVHHLLLIADENSEVSYLENTGTVGTSETTANIIEEVIACQNSKIKFASVDRLGQHTTTYLNRRGYLENDARVDWSMGMMNDGDIVGDFDSELVGTASHAEVKVVAISTGEQVQGIDTRVTNYGQHSLGNILQHGVILARSSLIFNGIGHIVHGAHGAEAQQESRVLMLSTKARGDANPILLIDDNDVIAGHAASVGRVDEQKMYYLMSRGIDKKTAERLVIRGFLGPVLSALPSKEVQQILADMIERKLVNGQNDE
ncbi:Fe-S cluster assembly protein SufD [Ligilactobacillus salitolerans]|uniref:Fe-S cluster assembly protein SufD n=1 Tax=Ligilactobacillus salitolerans TaxID=1808352 RepID=A0A401IR36_9LACO|nr:Fe-S cluster assembly protein SufD [Ligilactobacillus salitolerans]GBG93982.1 Fe-S cluster assembly protein SufD [Ligilactobacillus salitolerans]